MRDIGPDRYGCAAWFLGASTLATGANKKELKVAQKGQCYLCGKFVSRKRGTVDHVKPRSQGGGNLANKLLAHKRCNERKGDRKPHPCELLYLSITNTRVAKRRVELGRPA